MCATFRKLALDGQMAYIRQLAARRTAHIQAAPGLARRAEFESLQNRYLQQLNGYTVASSCRRKRGSALQGHGRIQAG